MLPTRLLSFTRRLSVRAEAESREDFAKVLNECFGIVELGTGSQTLGCSRRFDHIQLKFTCDVLDDRRLNGPLLFNICN